MAWPIRTRGRLASSSQVTGRPTRSAPRPRPCRAWAGPSRTPCACHSAHCALRVRWWRGHVRWHMHSGLLDHRAHAWYLLPMGSVYAVWLAHEAHTDRRPSASVHRKSHRSVRPMGEVATADHRYARHLQLLGRAAPDQLDHSAPAIRDAYGPRHPVKHLALMNGVALSNDT
jgi:hypothetical protein